MMMMMIDGGDGCDEGCDGDRKVMVIVIGDGDG